MGGNGTVRPRALFQGLPCSVEAGRFSAPSVTQFFFSLRFYYLFGAGPGPYRDWLVSGGPTRSSTDRFGAGEDRDRFARRMAPQGPGPTPRLPVTMGRISHHPPAPGPDGWPLRRGDRAANCRNRGAADTFFAPVVGVVYAENRKIHPFLLQRTSRTQREPRSAPTRSFNPGTSLCLRYPSMADGQ